MQRNLLTVRVAHGPSAVGAGQGTVHGAGAAHAYRHCDLEAQWRGYSPPHGQVAPAVLVLPFSTSTYSTVIYITSTFITSIILSTVYYGSSKCITNS